MLRIWVLKRLPRLFIGTALSFVDMNHPEEKLILTEIQKHNPPREGHPVPQKLPFDVKEIESFTYR